MLQVPKCVLMISSMDEIVAGAEERSDWTSDAVASRICFYASSKEKKQKVRKDPRFSFLIQ